MVLAALCAEGETTITDVRYIERGYDRLDEKLRSLGRMWSGWKNEETEESKGTEGTKECALSCSSVTSVPVFLWFLYSKLLCYRHLLHVP